LPPIRNDISLRNLCLSRRRPRRGDTRAHISLARLLLRPQRVPDSAGTHLLCALCLPPCRASCFKDSPLGSKQSQLHTISRRVVWGPAGSITRPISGLGTSLHRCHVHRIGDVFSLSNIVAHDHFKQFDARRNIPNVDCRARDGDFRDLAPDVKRIGLTTVE
jgi:hypothetical protein